MFANPPAAIFPDERMYPFNCGPLLRERANMHGLGGFAFNERFKPNPIKRDRVLLSPHFLRGYFNHIPWDEFGLHNHCCPLPGILFPRAESGPYSLGQSAACCYSIDIIYIYNLFVFALRKMRIPSSLVIPIPNETEPPFIPNSCSTALISVYGAHFMASRLR